LVEPIQGEGGVIPAPDGFLTELRRLADESGALLLADEIQTGIGRTGTFLGMQHEGVVPDAMSLAKGLAGGVPIGVMLCRRALETALPPGSHGSTFGGNPLASAAALAVLEALDEEKLIDGARDKGEHLARGLAELARLHERFVSTSRGRGLLQVLVLRDEVDARGVLDALRDAGLLVSLAGGQAVRFTPPLIITKGEIDEALSIVDSVFGKLA